MTTEQIWIKFHKQLKSFIQKRIDNPSIVDDILQDVFVKIHSIMDTMNDKTKVLSWVYQITRNTIIDYYRKQRLNYESIDNFEDISQEAEISINDEIACGLKDMISELPEKYADALLQVEFNGMAQTELAKKSGISISGAKTRVQRGRQILKDSLMKCCHYEFDKYGTIIDYHPISCCCCSQAN
jgi:RNA polymerase sigma-70 factor (ECF subfamily)